MPDWIDWKQCSIPFWRIVAPQVYPLNVEKEHLKHAVFQEACFKYAPENSVKDSWW